MALDINSHMYSDFVEANMLTDEDFNFDIQDDVDLEGFEASSPWEDAAHDTNTFLSMLIASKDDPRRANSIVKLETAKLSCMTPLEGSSTPDATMENDSLEEVQVSDDSVYKPVVKLEVLETPPDTPPSLEQGTPPSPVHLDLIAVTPSPVQVLPSVRVAVHHPKVKSESPYEVPRPPVGSLPNTTTTSSILSTPKPLVLTKQEFLQLSMQGVAHTEAGAVPLHEALKSLEANGSNNLNNNKAGPPFLSTLFPNNMAHLDEKAIKRQQRMIKNRESAFLSRKKKREYLQRLENQVMDLNMQNTQLQIENQKLKLRVVELEKENETLKRDLLPKNVKTTTCLLAVVFMITLNLAPFSGLLVGDVELSRRIPVNRPAHHAGRSLLWERGPSQERNDALPKQYMTEATLAHPDASLSSANVSAPTSKCPMYINKSESIRLESELRGWVLRLEKQKQKSAVPNNEASSKHLKKAIPPGPKFQAWIRQHTGMPYAQRVGQSKGQNELQIYKVPRPNYEDLLKALERREDTFYFVSFSGDHLLLPATAHNKTQRPKMSLVMPAMTLNETMEQPRGHVSMMQIDCEVMDTKMVFVKESLIPTHLLHKANRTSPIPRSPAAKRRQMWKQREKASPSP